MSPADVVLAAAIIGNGLLAGLYLAFVCAVSPGLRRVGDRTYVEIFRATNAAILTPWFLILFSGTPLATVAAAMLHDGATDHAGALALVLVGLAGAVGAFLVTVVRNVPLNRALAAAPVRTDAERTAARRAFEGQWNRWNLVRTVLSTAALVCLQAA